ELLGVHVGDLLGGDEGLLGLLAAVLVALGVVGEVPDLVDLAALVVGPAVLGCDPQELAPVGVVPAVPDDGGRVGGVTLVAPGLDVDRSAAAVVRGARHRGRRRAGLARPPRAAVERPVGLAA